MEWVAPLISSAGLVLVAVIETRASIIRKKDAKKLEEVKEAQKINHAVIDGVQALLRNELITKYNHYAEQQFIPIYGMENVLDMYTAYKALGGNGTAAKLVEALKTLPTEPPKEERT